jgi:hypothetical protein
MWGKEIFLDFVNGISEGFGVSGGIVRKALIINSLRVILLDAISFGTIRPFAATRRREDSLA